MNNAIGRLIGDPFIASTDISNRKERIFEKGESFEIENAEVFFSLIVRQSEWCPTHKGLNDISVIFTVHNSKGEIKSFQYESGSIKGLESFERLCEQHLRLLYPRRPQDLEEFKNALKHVKDLKFKEGFTHSESYRIFR